MMTRRQIARRGAADACGLGCIHDQGYEQLSAFSLLAVDFGLCRGMIRIRTIQPDAFGVARFVDLSGNYVPTLPEVHDAAVELTGPASRGYPDPILLSHFSLSLNQPSSHPRAATLVRG